MKRTPALFTAVVALLVVLISAWLAGSFEHASPAPSATSRPLPRHAAEQGRAAPSAPADVQQDPAVSNLLAAVEALLARRDVRAKEAVLTFKDRAALDRFLARAAQAGLAVIDRHDGLLAARVRFQDARDLKRDVSEHAGDLSEVAGNTLFRAPGVPKESRAALNQVPFRNETLSALGASGERAGWGRGVTIAILDTGIGADQTFGGDRLRHLDIGYGTAPGNTPGDAHGTAVAALAAGAARDAAGLAPEANLLSIRVTDADGLGDIFSLSRGIVAAVDAGAQIINVSLGGYGTSMMLANAIGYAVEHGAVVVAAAGNDQAPQLMWPAADKRVISVGAVDRAEQQVAFSNSGPQLQLTAPGYGVQTAWSEGKRAYMDGTSASAPLVAGAIAAVLSQNPSITTLEAARTLTRTANDAGTPGADPAFGNGILNVASALNASNPNYTDTAVSSHFFDAAQGELQVVVQNRGGSRVAGLSLTVSGPGFTADFTLGTLEPSKTQVISVPVDPAALKQGTPLPFTSNLANPAGITDEVPANNSRSSVLTPAPAPVP